MAQYLQRTANDNDDGYFAGSWLPISSSFGYGRAFSGSENYGAVRFNNVTIPQGAVITSAFLRLTDSQNQGARTVNIKLKGIDEDDTADFSSDPDGRAKTSAAVDWDFNSVSQVTNTERTSPDIASIIQEIIDRPGWASGNDLGIISDDDGTSNDNIMRWLSFSGDATRAPQLEINYVAGSPSVSPSPSPSISPSASVSPSASRSPSVSMSPSISRSPSPSPEDTAFVIDIAKNGIDVLNTNSPQDLKFSSRYGTLKYFVKANQIIQADGGASDFAAKGIYTHNLGYKPFAEVFVRVYIGSPTGNYELCPLFGSGASVAYNASYIIKDNTIELFGEFIGISSSVWNFDFLIFLYKNRLNL